MQQQPPYVLTPDNDKRLQGPITVAQLVEYPDIQLALDRIHRWTPAIKQGVADIMSNRTSFIMTGATPAQEQQFDVLMAKVKRCMATDPHVRRELSSAYCIYLLISHLHSDVQFAALMDPSYVIVNFGGAAVPADYRGWLDQINANIGGAPVGAAGPGNFNVTGGANQHIMFLDPTLKNLGLLNVNTRHNADHVAAQLKILGGLSSWVLETTVGPNYH